MCAGEKWQGSFLKLTKGRLLPSLLLQVISQKLSSPPIVATPDFLNIFRIEFCTSCRILGAPFLKEKACHLLGDDGWNVIEGVTRWKQKFAPPLTQVTKCHRFPYWKLPKMRLLGLIFPTLCKLCFARVNETKTRAWFDFVCSSALFSFDHFE